MPTLTVITMTAQLTIRSADENDTAAPSPRRCGGTTRARPGTGREMLAAAERRVAGAGRALCRLDCVTSNPRLRTYYEEAGYTVVGELAGKVAADGGTYGVLLLEKPLG
ncbi:hypothetical protein SALBM135S_03557 [Streptomyces alboniger]